MAAEDGEQVARASWGDVPAAAAILVEAFVLSRHRRLRRLRLVLCWPVALLMAAIAKLRSGLYVTDDGDGTVTVTRGGTGRLILAQLVIAAAWCTLILVLIVHLPAAATFVAQATAVLVLVVLTSCIAWLCFAHRASGDGWRRIWASLWQRKRLPKGRRWSATGLAQRPRTMFGAIELTRTVLESLPADAVVTATAITQSHAAVYTRLGFTRLGDSRDVYWTRPTATSVEAREDGQDVRGSQH